MEYDLMRDGSQRFSGTLPKGWVCVSLEDGFALAQAGANVMAWFSDNTPNGKSMLSTVIEDPHSGWSLGDHIEHAHIILLEDRKDHYLYLFVEIDS